MTFYGLLLVALCLASPRTVQAESRIGFELYSWKSGSQWYFSVLEGTSTAKSLAVIQSSKNRLKGPTFLKGRLATLPPGETLYWRVDRSRGLQLPSQEWVHDIAQFSLGSQLKLIVPGQDPPPRD